MDLTTQQQALFTQLPTEDLNLQGLAQCQKFRHERLTGILGRIASATTLGNTRLFNEAATEYRKIYNELVEAGMCFSENMKRLENEKRYKLKNLVGRIRDDVEDLEYSLKSLRARASATEKRLSERKLELLEKQEELNKFEEDTNNV